MAQGYILPDSSLSFAIQSGFGVPATTLKSAMGITDYDIKLNKTTIKGVPMLGRGYWRGQDIPTGVTVDWRVKGWGSITELGAFLAACASGVKGTTTVLATTGFSTPFTMNAKNNSKKYMTLAVIENETSAGVGLLKEMVRDAIAANVAITIQSKEAFTFEASGQAINEGPGAATGISYGFNTALHVPNLSNPATTITYPSIFPSGFCSTQLNLAYSAELAYGPNCIGSVEASDILVGAASWALSGQGIADTNFASAYKSINYGTTSPAANTSAGVATLQPGAITMLLVSDDIIASSSPTTPFSIQFYFPNMQYTMAHLTGASPRMGEWAADSFDSAMTITENNDLSSASMTLQN
jgi:hypothetical protein